jgi:hypothetical protein
MPNRLPRSRIHNRPPNRKLLSTTLLRRFPLLPLILLLLLLALMQRTPLTVRRLRSAILCIRRRRAGSGRVRYNRARSQDRTHCQDDPPSPKHAHQLPPPYRIQPLSPSDVNSPTRVGLPTSQPRPSQRRSHYDRPRLRGISPPQSIWSVAPLRRFHGRVHTTPLKSK